MRLIDPELIEAKGLVPLTKLLEAVEQMPLEQQETIEAELCAAQEAEDPPIARRIRGQLKQARADGDFPIQLILAALSIGKLKVYALRLATDSTYMVRSNYWHAFGSLHDPERSVKECNFVIDRAHFAEQTAEWEVANRPLFLTEKGYKQFLRCGPPSEAQVRRAAEAIVRQFELQNPDEGQKLKKNDFIEMIRKVLPACNKASAMRAWTACAPNSWKRRGRLPIDRQISD
jgi:hypothetical protein